MTMPARHRMLRASVSPLSDEWTRPMRLHATSGEMGRDLREWRPTNARRVTRLRRQRDYALAICRVGSRDALSPATHTDLRGGARSKWIPRPFGPTVGMSLGAEAATPRTNRRAKWRRFRSSKCRPTHPPNRAKLAGWRRQLTSASPSAVVQPPVRDVGDSAQMAT